MSEMLQLTPVEHELMEILWALGGGTVREVIAALPPHRKLAYTSVSTILRILQHKKILTANKVGKHHIYKPLLTKERYATHSLNKMVQQVFSGRSAELVAHLVDQQSLTVDEINEIQLRLEQKKRELNKC